MSGSDSDDSSFCAVNGINSDEGTIQKNKASKRRRGSTPNSVEAETKRTDLQQSTSTVYHLSDERSFLFAQK